LKSFILLYLTEGLGKSKTIASIFISITAIVMFIAAPIAGKLGDSKGKVQVSTAAALVFGIGLMVPFITTNLWIMLPLLPIIAFGGATVLTLPYAILIPMMPKDQHGKLTGLYSTSRGVGIMLGPLLAGVAITLTKNVLPQHGYSAMWIVCASAMLLSTLPLLGIIHQQGTSSVKTSLFAMINR
jgi:MFS family permease